MELSIVTIDKPDPINFVLGQAHFIKSVEDIHEAIVASVPGIGFGLAFCEASGDCLVRFSGTDPIMIDLAQRNATSLSTGHSFVVFLAEGYYPINILNAIKKWRVEYKLVLPVQRSISVYLCHFLLLR